MNPKLLQYVIGIFVNYNSDNVRLVMKSDDRR